MCIRIISFFEVTHKTSVGLAGYFAISGSPHQFTGRVCDTIHAGTAILFVWYFGIIYYFYIADQQKLCDYCIIPVTLDAE
jgi:hypothetical protein